MAFPHLFQTGALPEWASFTVEVEIEVEKRPASTLSWGHSATFFHRSQRGTTLVKVTLSLVGSEG